ncbi:unnamed protein product [Brassica oleracea]
MLRNSAEYLQCHQWITTTPSFHARTYTSPLTTMVSPSN